MVLRKYSTRTSYRYMIGAIAKPIQLLKRNDDQQQGTVRSVVVYNCRRSDITKTGQTLAGDMVSDHRASWLIPMVELKRVGVNYLNPLDRIVEFLDDGRVPIDPHRWWQPEATTTINSKLFENWYEVFCLRVDPNPPEQGG